MSLYSALGECGCKSALKFTSLNSPACHSLCETVKALREWIFAFNSLTSKNSFSQGQGLSAERKFKTRIWGREFYGQLASTFSRSRGSLLISHNSALLALASLIQNLVEIFLKNTKKKWQLKNKRDLTQIAKPNSAHSLKAANLFSRLKGIVYL